MNESTSSTPASQPLSPLIIASLNINNDYRLKEFSPNKTPHLAAAFKAYSFKERLSLLQKLFDSYIQKGTDIFILQEINKESREKITALFKEKGYQTIFHPYSGDENSFWYLTTYNPATVTYNEQTSRQIFFTQSGKPTSEEDRKKLSAKIKFTSHLRATFDRSAQALTFKLKQPVSDTAGKNADEIVVINIHPGLDNKHRVLVMEKLGEALKGEQRPIIAMGDFNQFDATKLTSVYFPDQVKKLEDYGFTWTSKNLAENGVQATFMSFPYDIDRFLSNKEKLQLTKLKEQFNQASTSEEKEKIAKTIKDTYGQLIQEKKISLLGGCLDAVYTRNLPSNNLKVSSKILVKSLETGNFMFFNGGKSTSKAVADNKKNKLGTVEAQNLLTTGIPSSDHFAIQVKVKRHSCAMG